MSRKHVGLHALIAVLATSMGCSRSADSPSGPESGCIVVYTALDRPFSEPILDQFTRETGIRVDAVYDAESTKTIGLVNRIRMEAARPRCDVFWNNEILNTLRLQKEGLLQPCEPAGSDSIPPAFRDPQSHWYGFAARARVLVVNTNIVAESDLPTSIGALADPRWKGRCGIAKPLFGTTASHAAILFAQRGVEGATRFFDSLKENKIQVLSGNRACAQRVADGGLALALTDTDDAVLELRAGKPVRIIFPDSGPNDDGTIFLPNTLSMVRGAPHPAEALKLIEFLLRPQIEEALAAGESAQIPVRTELAAPAILGDLSNVKRPVVDFAAAADAFPDAARYIESHFLE